MNRRMWMAAAPVYGVIAARRSFEHLANKQNSEQSCAEKGITRG